MTKLTKIAITGGPCSGKTSAINAICEKLNSDNRNVILCPEAATIVIDKGVSRDDYLLFEAEVAKCQIELEKEAISKAEKLDGDVLIIFDRALTDCFSYIDDKTALADTIGVDYLSSWNRYDSIIMLESAPCDYFVQNEIRTETYEDSVKCEEELLKVFVGHPHFRYIKNTENFEDKIDNLKSEIDTILNGIETEVKYLIEYPDFEELEKIGAYKTEISQTYLLSNIGSHRIRSRKTGDVITYFETLKIRISGMSANEDERIISKEEYDELLELADPNKNTIIKDRYCFLYDGQYFELDVFPFWNDKAFVELELTNEKQKVNLPPFINVIKDVSSDPKYKNNYLAGLKL